MKKKANTRTIEETLKMKDRDIIILATKRAEFANKIFATFIVDAAEVPKAYTCSKLTTETLEQGVIYIQS